MKSCISILRNNHVEILQNELINRVSLKHMTEVYTNKIQQEYRNKNKEILKLKSLYTRTVNSTKHKLTLPHLSDQSSNQPLIKCGQHLYGHE